jgi:hypothetical protein
MASAAAAARPQSIFSADIYLSDNTGRAPALAFAQDVRVAGWTTVGDGAGRKKGSGAYVIYDCVILTKEVRFYYVGVLLLVSGLTFGLV